MGVSLFCSSSPAPSCATKPWSSRLPHRTVFRAQCAEGVRRFTAGLVKKALLANNIGWSLPKFWAMGRRRASWRPGGWRRRIRFRSTLILRAILIWPSALASCLALPEENFNLRTHRAASRVLAQMAYFARHLVSRLCLIPLAGNRCGWGRQLFNIAVVWLLTGLGMAPAGISCCGARTTPCC